MIQQSHFWVSIQNNWKQGLTYLHTQVHSRTIRNIHAVEATQMSIKEWMDKQKVIYAYNSIVFSLKKKSNLVTCYNMDEAWGTLSELSQLQKDKYYYDSTYMKHLK